MDSNGALVLVVEDERSMARVMSASLQARGYEVRIARTGQDALDRSAAEDPAVIILDLGLPDIDGIDVCRQVRRWSRAPIIVVTAEGAEDRKIRALDEGADDYVTKPFSMPELLARLRVALRHRAERGPLADEDLLEVGALVVDVADHQVSVNGRRVDLTPKEFDFLVMLARHAGKVLTHRAILHFVWGPDADGHTEYLRTYANQLRRKLGTEPGTPHLVSEPGVGYRLVTEEADADLS
jgi:two-component system KDP operon response regulator KdpE